MPVDEEPVSANEWTSNWKEEHGKVSANPINPLGWVVREPVSLDLSEWDCVLAPKDWVLDMHIPAGGKMSPDACQDSLARAKGFFQKYFPETPPKAVVCWSWIYSPVLDQVLPPDSNLVKNMRESYLFPYPSDARDGLGFIFYQDEINLTTAPTQTSVQRAFLEFLNRGKRWRCGAMFYLMEDIQFYGSQVYRRQSINFSS